MAYRDYELDRDYGNRGNWRGRSEFDRDRWYGGYGAGGYGDWDRGWNRASYGGWGGGAYGPEYNYGRGEPWYGGGYGYQGQERGYGNQGFDRGYGYGGYDRGYPGYGGYGYGGYTGYGYGGYGGGYGNNAGEWRGTGTGMGYDSGTSRYQGGTMNQGRWGQQSHAGRGPRNYQRSDDRIEEDVNEALTRHPALDASEIDVKVQNGEVTLTGTVDSRQDKRMAEDAAESCSGVRDVHNQLRVSSSGSRTTEREVSRTPTQEGRSSQSGESRSGSRQASSRSSR
ncbi:MAG TPA: BON domain-containing protein [Gemmatimonadaceae bacterium]|nr:BON domain-containing protein [Gemmatimonadaceae bacterium]